MLRSVVSGLMLTLLLIGIIGMLTSAFNIPPVGSEPTTWTVDDDEPADFHTIQEAINVAEKGDAVFVRSGTYYEHVVVDKYLSLIGENRSNIIIDGNGTGNVVEVTARNVRITGFTIQNSGTDIYGGIYVVEQSTGNNISGNIVTNNYYGVWLYLSSNNSVSGNIITNNFHGVRLYSSSNNTVSGNKITNNGLGVYLSRSSNNTISGNRITKNDSGIAIFKSSKNSVCENNIKNNHDGIYLTYGRDNTFVRNNVTANNMDGLGLFDSSNNNDIYENNVTNNYYGVELCTSVNNTFSENNIKNNHYGVWLYWSTKNKFHRNNFINNTRQVDVRSPDIANFWDEGYPSGGNYWSDFKERYPDVEDVYSGPDQDQPGSDGFWDDPYVIDENNQDNHPIVPEFPSFLILPLFMIVTLLAVIVYRRKLSR